MLTYKEAREAKGLKAVYVAEKLGMSKANYSLKENYQRNFKTDEIMDFCKIVGCKASDLYVKNVTR